VKLFWSAFCRFLKDIRYYKALSQEQQAALGSSGPLDAATKRVQKIRRFQLERAIMAELDTMNMQVPCNISLFKIV